MSVHTPAGFDRPLTTATFRAQCLPEDLVVAHLASGQLVQALDAWSPKFAGYYIYYPSRRQLLPAFRVIVDALRHGDG